MKRIFTCIVYAAPLFLASLLVAQPKQEPPILIMVSTRPPAKVGPAQQPSLSLSAAVRMAHTYQQQHPGRGIDIRLQPGAYFLDSTLLLNAGDFNGPVTFRAAATSGAPVTISGGESLQVQWRLWKNGIYQASLDVPYEFSHLFINGEQQIRARYPNYDSSAKHFNGTAADALSPARIKTWQHPEGGYIHALHRAEWGGYHYRITGVNADGTLQLEGGYQNNRQMGMNEQHRFVENIFEELDAEREWYYDKAGKTLYYKPVTGRKLPAAVVVSRFSEIVVLKGTAAAPVKDITFKGIRFAHSNATFMDTREPLLRSDWAIYRGGAVLLNGTQDCHITDCEFDQNGGNAVFVSNYNRRASISGCHIHDAGGSGICFVGNPDAVRAPLFEYNQSPVFDGMDTVAGPKNPDYPDSCTAYNNLIYRTGRIEKQSAGVQISMAMDITVAHNTIYTVPRAGINVSEGTWGGHLIEYNDVFNTVLETGDHGAFNSWGRDRWWYPNREMLDSMAALHPWMIKQDAMKTTTLRYNRFRCDHGWDIDLDDGSSNYHIYSNVCLNGGLKLREGFFRTVENNIILNNSFHPHVWFANSHDIFRHNIVTSSYKPIGINYWGDEIDHNLFPDPASINTPTDTHSLSGDPLFAAAAKGDYRVQPGSPALKTGFKNFPMDQFGVVSPALKALAAKPPLPVLKTVANTGSATSNWMGARVKNIETLGERSAAGLPDNQGVFVVTVTAGFRYAVKAGDVILQLGDKNVNNVETLQQATAFYGDKKVKLVVFRNQQRVAIP